MGSYGRPAGFLGEAATTTRSDTQALGPDAPGKGALKLSDIAYARIASGIASGDYSVGQKLPTEHELADQLSVSRPIVREALSRLRDDGLVVSRRGSGTYVKRAPLPEDRGLGPLSSIADMRRCLDFRFSLECEAARHAAAALTDRGEQALRAALARLEQSIAVGEIGVDEDFEFHLAIARATENRFFAASMSAMREPITAGMNITRHFALLRTRERLAALHAEHVRIAEAIFDRREDDARAAMAEHLSNAMARAFDGA
jgi:DNA-binding FadR family transcriptional regulator